MPASASITQRDPALLASLTGAATALGMTGIRIIRKGPQRDCWDLRATASGALPRLAALGYIWGRKSVAKRIPPGILGADAASAHQFLSAFVAAEGSVSKRASRGTLDISTASVGMAHDLCTLLRRSGIYARIRSYSSMATNGSRISRTYYRVSVSGASLRRFTNLIGCEAPAKAERLARILDVRANDSLDTVFVADIVPLAKRLTGLTQDTSGGLFANAAVTGRHPTMLPTTAARLAVLLEGHGEPDTTVLATVLRRRIAADIFFVRVREVVAVPSERYLYGMVLADPYRPIVDHVITA